jgi:hypothetical protein
VTAEPIATVVADIRAGRVQHHVPDPAINTALLDRARAPQPVVDTTAIYRALLDRATGDGINLYDDFPSVASPWDDALVCYVNDHGNVLVLQVRQIPWDDGLRWDTDNPVDWEQVRWLVETTVWIGGRSGDGKVIPTSGPVHLLQHAVYGDGRPADMHWVALLGRHDEETWQMPLATLNATLNFLACSNVEVAEPARPFPVRRRLRQQRVQVQTIVVRPPGKRRAGGVATARPMDALDTPLSPVRGSFGHYGPDYDRGLLFGKLAGKFWRPAHARGAGDGFEQKDYLLKPAKENAR